VELPFDQVAAEKILSLRELAGLIAEALELGLPQTLSVVAEIARLNLNTKSGHAYLELVEKQEEKVVAQMKGIIWAETFAAIRKKFLEQAGTELQAGLKVLMLGRISYHEVYGLSFKVLDIDVSYTLGEMALKRRETLERLSREGIIDRNKSLPFPLVPQRLAVVTSETAAGYGDFLERLRSNPYGYTFQITLFPAYVQGEQAEMSLLRALSLVAGRKNDFDVVIFIRGGGSQVDLHVFDSYQLAKEAAFFPLPVLAGIGHERDQPVINHVAWRGFITPTAVAEFLVGKVREFEEEVEEAAYRLLEGGRSFLETSSQQLRQLMHRLQSAMMAGLQSPASTLAALQSRLGSSFRSLMQSGLVYLELQKQQLRKLPPALVNRWKETLAHDCRRLALLDPVNVLKRGYSITYLDGQAVKEVKVLTPGKTVLTRLYQGAFVSKVSEIKTDGRLSPGEHTKQTKEVNTTEATLWKK